MTEYGGPKAAGPQESERWSGHGARESAEGGAPTESDESAESGHADVTMLLTEADETMLLGEAVEPGPGTAAAAEPAGPAGSAERSEPDETEYAAEPEDVDQVSDDEPEQQFEGPADPQEWIDQLIQVLLTAEQGIGAGPRDALMARIKLAQAYSEIGDPTSAAPLAVENVLQAEELFPASESWLRGLRDFRDAVCEAAGWSASQMRRAEPELAFVSEPEPQPEPAAEPVPAAPPVAETDSEVAAEAGFAPPAPSEAGLGGEFAPPEDETAFVTEFVTEYVPADDGFGEPEAFPDVVVVEETVIVSAGPDDGTVEVVEVVEAVRAFDPVEAGTDAEHDDGEFVISDAAAYEEIIRLRYELRDARRTIDRLRHVNAKLREALAYELD